MDMNIKLVKMYPFKFEGFKIHQNPKSELKILKVFKGKTPDFTILDEIVTYKNLSKNHSDFEVNDLPIKTLPVSKGMTPMSYTVDQLIDDMQSKYANGQYPKYWVCKDGGILSHEAVIQNFWQILDQFYELTNPQWNVIGCEINYEDKTLVCSHTGKPIESAY